LKRGQAQEVKKGLFRSLAKQVGIDSHSAIIQRPPVGVKPISQGGCAANLWVPFRQSQPLNAPFALRRPRRLGGRLEARTGVKRPCEMSSDSPGTVRSVRIHKVRGTFPTNLTHTLCVISSGGAARPYYLSRSNSGRRLQIAGLLAIPWVWSKKADLKAVPLRGADPDCEEGKKHEREAAAGRNSNPHRGIFILTSRPGGGGKEEESRARTDRPPGRISQTW